MNDFVPSTPGFGDASEDPERWCSPETAEEFVRAWANTTHLTSPDERCRHQAWVLAMSRWLRGAAFLQEVGNRSSRSEHAAAVIDRLVDEALDGKQFTPHTDHFTGYWWRVVRAERIDYWRERARRRLIEEAVAYSRGSAAKESLLSIDLADAIEQLPERERAFIELVHLDGIGTAAAVRQLAERFGVSPRSIQRDAANAYEFLSQRFA